MAEEPHDDGQRDALPVEVHGLGLAEHVAVDVAWQGGQLARAVRAACVSTDETVLAESPVGCPWWTL